MALVPTFKGYIEDENDSLLIFEATINGNLQRVIRRPYENERPQLIVSGNVFVFIEEEAGIKRWTDGVSWSPSRILGKFLMYREINKNDNKNQNNNNNNRNTGFVKKTISIRVSSTNIIQSPQTFHLVSYYLDEDVRQKKLITPKNSPLFRNIINAKNRPFFSNINAPEILVKASPSNDPANGQFVHYKSNIQANEYVRSKINPNHIHLNSPINQTYPSSSPSSSSSSNLSLASNSMTSSSTQSVAAIDGYDNGVPKYPLTSNTSGTNQLRRYSKLTPTVIPEHFEKSSTPPPNYLLPLPLPRPNKSYIPKNNDFVFTSPQNSSDKRYTKNQSNFWVQPATQSPQINIVPDLPTENLQYQPLPPHQTSQPNAQYVMNYGQYQGEPHTPLPLQYPNRASGYMPQYRMIDVSQAPLLPQHHHIHLHHHQQAQAQSQPPPQPFTNLNQGPIGFNYNPNVKINPPKIPKPPQPFLQAPINYQGYQQ